MQIPGQGLPLRSRRGTGAAAVRNCSAAPGGGSVMRNKGAPDEPARGDSRMKLLRVSLLLMGGCASLASLGCAAWQAAVDGGNFAAGSPDATSSRMAAIARTYENQGQYERAEATYLRALRLQPSDPVIRERVEQLAARRRERTFGAAQAETAIAAADALNGNRPAVRAATFPQQEAAATVAGTSEKVDRRQLLQKESAESSKPEDFGPAVSRKLQREMEQAVAWAEFAPLPPDAADIPQKQSPAVESETDTLVADTEEASPAAAASAEDSADEVGSPEDSVASVEPEAAEAEVSDVAVVEQSADEPKAAEAEAEVPREESIAAFPAPAEVTTTVRHPDPFVAAVTGSTAPEVADLSEEGASATEPAAESAATTENISRGETSGVVTLDAVPEVAEASSPWTRRSTPTGQVQPPAEAETEDVMIVHQDTVRIRVYAEEPSKQLEPKQLEPIVLSALPAPVEASTEVLKAVESGRDHVDLLIAELQRQDDFEAAALSAIMLGECDVDDTRIRNALAEALVSCEQPAVLLAVCDSQVQRGEQSISTCRCLREIAMHCGATDIQIQAVSLLGRFSDSAAESDCEESLLTLLTHENDSVRRVAALTLGDKRRASSGVLAQLTIVAASDDSSQVREAALIAVECLTDGLKRSESAVPVGPARSTRGRLPRHSGDGSIKILPAR